MATLKENYEALIDGLTSYTDKKAKETSENIKTVDQEIQNVDAKVESVKATATRMGTRLAGVESDLKNKLDSADLKTLNGQSLKGNENDTDLTIFLPKENELAKSSFMSATPLSYTKPVIKLGGYYPIKPTQTEIDNEMASLQSDSTKISDYYYGSYAVKYDQLYPYMQSQDGVINLDIENGQNGDLIFVKLSYVYKNNDGSGVSQQEAYYLTEAEITVANGWTLLDDQVNSGYASSDWYYMRQVIYYKVATRDIDNFSATIEPKFDIYPKPNVFARTISNVESFRYIKRDEYQELYKTYHEENPSVDKGILPVPELADDELALICSSNIADNYTWVSSSNFTSPTKITQTSFTYFDFHGMMLSDEPCGFAASTEMTDISDSTIYARYNKAMATCIILKGVKNPSDTVVMERYNCMYKIDDFGHLYASLLTVPSVNEVTYYKRRPITYEEPGTTQGTYTANTELANKQYVIDRTYPKDIYIGAIVTAQQLSSNTSFSTDEFSFVQISGNTDTPGRKRYTNSNYTQAELKTFLLNGLGLGSGYPVQTGSYITCEFKSVDGYYSPRIELYYQGLRYKTVTINNTDMVLNLDHYSGYGMYNTSSVSPTYYYIKADLYTYSTGGTQYATLEITPLAQGTDPNLDFESLRTQITSTELTEIINSLGGETA